MGGYSAFDYFTRAIINVTLLIDVMLVLLVLFIIIASPFASGIAVKLTNLTVVKVGNPHTSIIATTARNDAIYLDYEMLALRDFPSTCKQNLNIRLYFFQDK